jgi:hypothetical protein
VGAADPREPRARRSFTRGGVQPSSEVEFRPRGRPAPERGRVSVVRRWAPRAKRSFARGAPGLAGEVARAVGSCRQAMIAWDVIYNL